MLWILALALAPGAFWLLYFYSRDRMDPEPRRLVLKTFLLGMAVAPAAALVEALFFWVGIFLLVVIVGPVIEEIAKYLVVTRTVFKREEFNEPIDGIIYAAAAGLGFATLENVGYLIGAQATGMLGETFWARALLSVPGHALFSSMWGYALGWSLLIVDEEPRRRFVRRGVWLAIGLHGLFNFLALTTPVTGLFGAVLLLILIVFVWRAVHRRISSALHYSRERPMEHPDEGERDRTPPAS